MSMPLNEEGGRAWVLPACRLLWAVCSVVLLKAALLRCPCAAFSATSPLTERTLGGSPSILSTFALRKPASKPLC